VALRDPIALAAAFGLLLITDELGKARPSYITNDLTPRSVLPKLGPGHWRVRRFDEPPRLIPRTAV
jgi:hypothetical protein